jgi:flagellar biosynthesis protein FlhB
MNAYANTVANIFTPQGIVGFIQFLIFIVMVIYTFFAFLLTRQLNLMNKSFTTPMAPYFRWAALAHLFAALILTGITFLVI